MKQTTKMSRAVGQLEKIYNTLNEDFFEGLLPVPIITVQSKPGTYGHCSVAKVWQRPDGSTYELNIAAEVLNYPIEETLDTMIHEMVHLYCRENGIDSRQEVSVRMTREDLSYNLGLSVRTINRLVQSLRAQNALTVRSGKIHITADQLPLLRSILPDSDPSR